MCSFFPCNTPQSPPHVTFFLCLFRVYILSMYECPSSVSITSFMVSTLRVSFFPACPPLRGCNRFFHLCILSLCLSHLHMGPCIIFIFSMCVSILSPCVTFSFVLPLRLRPLNSPRRIIPFPYTCVPSPRVSLPRVLFLCISSLFVHLK